MQDMSCPPWVHPELYFIICVVYFDMSVFYKIPLVPPTPALANMHILS